MSGFLDGEDKKEEEPEEEVIDVEAKEVAESGDTGNVPAPKVDENSLVRPVEDIEEVVEVYSQFEEIKDSLLQSSDTTSIGSNVHVNKSGWRKIATAFNVSTELSGKSRTVEDGVVTFEVIVRAVAPNGKYADGVAMCASNESNHMDSLKKRKDKSKDDEDVLKVDGKWRVLKPPKEVNDHNIYATAYTRATNRAISDLVGGGEVSAEEINKDDVL